MSTTQNPILQEGWFALVKQLGIERAKQFIDFVEQGHQNFINPPQTLETNQVIHQKVRPIDLVGCANYQGKPKTLEERE